MYSVYCPLFNEHCTVYTLEPAVHLPFCLWMWSWLRRALLVPGSRPSPPGWSTLPPRTRTSGSTGHIPAVHFMYTVYSTHIPAVHFMYTVYSTHIPEVHYKYTVCIYLKYTTCIQYAVHIYLQYTLCIQYTVHIYLQYTYICSTLHVYMYTVNSTYIPIHLYYSCLKHVVFI